MTFLYCYSMVMLIKPQQKAYSRGFLRHAAGECPLRRQIPW